MTTQRMVPRLGDVIELPVAGRYAYLQYVNHHREPPRFGALIRVLPGLFEQRPDSLDGLCSRPEGFIAFFPLGAALRGNHGSIVGNKEIPIAFNQWPLFKGYNENIETGDRTWWLWDGRKSWCIGKLNADQYDLPMHETINLTCLHNRILRGWAARDEVRPEDKA